MESRQISDIAARQTARLSPEARQALGARVQAVCKRRGVTGRKLAGRTGLGIGTVMDLLAGRSDPYLSTLLAVAAELEIGSIEELLGSTATEQLLAIQRRAATRARTA